MAKKIKKAANKSFNYILKMWASFIAFILGFLGVSNCIDPDVNLYGVVVAYGVPTAEYTVKGKITSSSTPIPAIKVTSTDKYFTGQDVTSDENGNYSIKFTTLGAVDDQFIINFIDVDGAENGSFQDKDITVNVNKSDFIDDTPNNSWDDGKGEKTVDVELDPE